MLDKAFVVFVVVFHIVTAVDEEKTKNITIEDLEKQKSELFKQINFAIDDSVKTLFKANGTEASLGLQYMRDLKEHIKQLNKSDNNSKEEKRLDDVDSKSDLENRRSFIGLEYFKKTRKPSDDPFNFESVLRPKKISEKDWKEMIGNRHKMQQKLDLWLLEREKEKERIKKNRNEKRKLIMSGKYEKCPRFGYQGKKREKKNYRDKITCVVEFNTTTGKRYEKCRIPDAVEDTTERGDRRKQTRNIFGMNKYPCCRKCCKKSYMGCL